MEIITDLERANAILKKYSGANAQIHLFSTSLVRLVLRLVSSEFDEVIYLVGVGCQYIAGEFNWKNADICITEDQDDAELKKIVDANSDFTLVISGGFGLAHGEEGELQVNFDWFP